MVNNINPTTSKLLEQIQRLSAPASKKEANQIDFKDTVISNRIRTDKELKRTDLLNSIERIQRKNNISAAPPADTKKKIFTGNTQPSEWTQFVDTQKNHRREPLGTVLDIYL
ncbi:MAG: hypothetical protein L3J18_01575 [Candidatus Brocadia sp.]|jgi:hypothetical protein|uniref:Uncharacterized protein n=1 Tax=Candidatus Brocadia fulgida TaxID=380242 RepID=A0A0M2USZ7_9BACT|nr:MAG: hypothetical protein BROFUL_02572 [Candidatus Brocadia fulgida]UJS21039.1 MAG: hypothetical protein L3J18_01575 [Candidatus Brocadia sp.]